MNQQDHQEDPQPGDLIEIDRGHFKHWAVFVGSKMVVHLIVNNQGDTKAPVKMEKLKDVVQGSQWKINNLLDGQKKPQLASLIVEEALEQVGTEHRYNVLLYNCEHFVTRLRYGISESLQVRKAGEVAMAAGVATVVGLGLVALAGAFFGGGNKEKKKNTQ